MLYRLVSRIKCPDTFFKYGIVKVSSPLSRSIRFELTEYSSDSLSYLEGVCFGLNFKNFHRVESGSKDFLKHSFVFKASTPCVYYTFEL